jgi:hypothetical protein
VAVHPLTASVVDHNRVAKDTEEEAGDRHHPVGLVKKGVRCGCRQTVSWCAGSSRDSVPYLEGIALLLCLAAALGADGLAPVAVPSEEDTPVIRPRLAGPQLREH